MNICKALAQYQVIESLNAKRVVVAYLESLLKKGGLPHQSLVFLNTEIDEFWGEIEILNRALGYYRKPSISVRA